MSRQVAADRDRRKHMNFQQYYIQQYYIESHEI